MRSVVRKSLLGVAAAISISIATSLPAQAGITFELGNNPQPDEENILLNGDGSGATIFGETNQSHLNVKFYSNSDTLMDPPNGQARMDPMDGFINHLEITVPGGFYRDMILNPIIKGESHAYLSVLTSLSNTYNFDYALGNGENFLTFYVDAAGMLGGEKILKTTITSQTGFEQLKQPRISGAQLDEENPPSETPEPASMALLGLGAAPLLRRLRRKNAAA